MPNSSPDRTKEIVFNEVSMISLHLSVSVDSHVSR